MDLAVKKEVIIVYFYLLFNNIDFKKKSRKKNVYLEDLFLFPHFQNFMVV